MKSARVSQPALKKDRNSTGIPVLCISSKYPRTEIFPCIYRWADCVCFQDPGNAVGIQHKQATSVCPYLFM
uniref:Uncharacterized protein n=1 Tax=Faecalibaculum rodentium TaxID=1702221 RepID=A0A140DUN4_9FIRM|nr:hypothetical protein AALO17_12270 [Faecalibaculum rodentium]